MLKVRTHYLRTWKQPNRVRLEHNMQSWRVSCFDHMPRAYKWVHTLPHATTTSHAENPEVKSALLTVCEHTDHHLFEPEVFYNNYCNASSSKAANHNYLELLKEWQAWLDQSWRDCTVSTVHTVRLTTSLLQLCYRHSPMVQYSSSSLNK